MARLLVIGTGPLLDSDTTVMSGQCLRTWHFVGPLLAAGHEVVLATVPIPGTTVDDGAPATGAAEYRGLRYLRLAENAPHAVLPHLKTLLDMQSFDAAIGINAHPAFLLAQLVPPCPIWADLNGWTMAEGVSRAAIVGHDRDFPHFWRQEAAVLLVAERFSTVSRRQAWALYGELAMLGGLSSLNFDEDLVLPVPNAVYPDYARLERRPGVPEFLQSVMPETAAICLWAGGFNTWTNVDLLTGALSCAMGEEPGLHFVATGGPVIGHDEQTYKDFLRLAEERLPRERVHTLGWVPLDQVLALHATAVCGVNVDGQNIETKFGARNRLTNMLGAGMPLITTRGTEIAEWMEERRAGCVVAPDSAEEFAAAIVETVRNREMAEKTAAEQRALALHEFAPENTLKSFLAWCASPPAGKERPHKANMPQEDLRRLIADALKQENPFAPPVRPEEKQSPIRRIIRRLSGASSE